MLLYIKVGNETVTQAFDGVAELLANLDPNKIVKLHAPPEISIRVEELVNKKGSGDFY